ncbi:MAG: hypothetical protein Hyperionvirus13_39 [Hyperionvirus sp.]|uniref:Uncharacterized protein n=1 Tax=Hyperionvirus sp. TaxID=2487770 RepID=A0A3G5A9E2_9VIRU|nr:MAG: hypothetical protein Hyperionvirus13_39 [Hyperionvirus sp.]
MTDDAGYARYMDYIQNRLSLDEYPAEEEQEQEQEQEVMGQDFLLEEKLLRGYDKDSGTGELNLIEKEEMYPIQGFNLPLQASPSDDNFAGYVY